MTPTRVFLRQPETWFKALCSALVLSFMLSLVPLSYTMIEEQSFSYKHWFKYYDITATKPSIKVGEILSVTSDSEIVRKVEMRWSDTLFCAFDDDMEFIYYSDYQSGPFLVNPRAREKRKWSYGGRVPKEDSVCFLHSTITGVMKFAKDKTQTITTPPFEIRENAND